MDLPACADFPLSASTHFLYFDGGRDRIFGHNEPVVIDVRTRSIYEFPTFSSTSVSFYIAVDIGYMLIGVVGYGYA